MRLLDQGVERVEVTEERVDGERVRNVIAAVCHGREVEGGQPERVDPELGQVGQPVAYALQVADPVAVAIRETADVDLVEDGSFPPLGADSRVTGMQSALPPSVVTTRGEDGHAGDALSIGLRA